MVGWKNYSALVEINPDSMLQQLQDGLVEDGLALQKLLAAGFPDAVQVCSKIEEIKFKLLDHPEDISDRWVTAHVQVGEKTRFIAKRPMCQVSMSIFFCVSYALFACAQFSCRA